MTFADDLVLDDADGTDVTYRLISRDSNGSKRIDIATDLRNPCFLRIAHTTQGKNQDAIDRHLVQVTKTLTNAVGIQRTAGINVTLNIPRDGIITNQVVYDLVANVLDLLSDGALTTALSDTDAVQSLLRGES